jgi:NADH dehydrogenase [ubiquinone] 1 alpha subcomplex assembly factor 5
MTPPFSPRYHTLNTQRHRPTFKKHDFLARRVIQNLSDRFGDIQRRFETGFFYGGRWIDRTEIFPSIDKLYAGDCVLGLNNHVVMDENFIPLPAQGMEAILSVLSLHNVNDLTGALIQYRHALKADGVFMAALFGGESLFELRQVLMQAEMDITGGMVPRIHPVADKAEMGALMQRAGFALPVVDSDVLTITYRDLPSMLHELRGMGESSLLSSRKRPLSRAILKRAEELYRAQFSTPDGRLSVTCEIIYLIGWSPHESQQKPLKRGSAQMRLADALGSIEHKD